jgi:hypothetical protein
MIHPKHLVSIYVFLLMTSVYMRHRKEGYVLRKLQRGLSAIETWCEHWNIKIIEGQTQVTYFSNSLRPLESHIILNGRNIPFVNHAKYLYVIFEKRITRRIHTEMIEAKAFRIFLTIYSQFKSEHLRSNIKLTLHKALIRSVMTYACPAWELAEDA